MLRRLEGYTQMYYTLVMKGCQEKILLSYVDPECCITLGSPPHQASSVADGL